MDKRSGEGMLKARRGTCAHDEVTLPVDRSDSILDLGGTPELFRGTFPSSKSDVYAWGHAVAFSARGGHPFTETPDTSELMTVLSTEPGLAHMRRLVGAAMAKDPATRPTTGQILDGLTTLTGEDHDRLPHDPPF